MEPRGKIALVTGGAHRVGKAIALELARAGAHVAFTYLASGEAARQTRAEIEAMGVPALAVRCDQSDPAQVTQVFEQVRAAFGRLDILVNSAAIMQKKPFLEISLQDWDQTIDINLRGPFLMTQAAARIMLDNNAELGSSQGVIVNIADGAGLRPWPDYVHHSVSKAGVVMLTQAAALALAPRIRVNAISPGAVLKPDGWNDTKWEALRPSIPLARLGSPEDVARAVRYLVREEYITGQVIVVDGGRVLK
jgi:pteridine reductase